MSFDVSEYLFNSGTALVLHGDQSVVDGDLVQIAELPDTAREKITSVALSNTQLTDACLQYLSALPNLYALYVQGTVITDNAPIELLAKNLEVVNFDNTLVGDKAIEKLRLARNLRVLSARYTRVTDYGVDRLLTLTKLQEYYLAGTQVSMYGKRRLDNAMFQMTFLSCLKCFLRSAQITQFRFSRCLSLP